MVCPDRIDCAPRLGRNWGKYHMESGWDTSSMVAIRRLVCRVSLIRILLFMFAALLLAYDLKGKAGSDARQPLWSAEVLHGVTPRNCRFPLILDRNRAGVTFVDNRRLLVHEVNSERHVPSSAKYTDSFKPIWLHAYVLDSDTGKELFSKEWGTSSRDSSVALVVGGILVRTGTTLRLLNQEFMEIQEKTFRDEPGINHFQWGILHLSVSPTGTTVMVNLINQRADESHLEIFNGSNLSPRGSWTQTPALYHLYSISDSEIAAADHNQNQLMRTRFGSGEWQVFGEKTEDGCLNQPTFITADLLLVPACGRLLLVDTQGHSRSLYVRGQTASLAGKVAFSSVGNLVVFSVAEMQIKKHLFSEPTVHVVGTDLLAYNLRSEKIVLDVKVSPLPSTDYDFDVSPDGSKAAILCDRTVSVYRIMAYDK
jgi:hypothetical protein